MNKLCLLILLVCGGVATAYALDPASLVRGQAYIATGQINVRTTPPSGLFYSLGDIKGVINKNDKLIIKDIQLVKTLMGKHYWLLIEKIEPAGNKLTGWIYGGDPGQQTLLEKAP